MRRVAFLLAMGSFFQPACAAASFRKIGIEIPRYSTVAVDNYKIIIITNFQEKEETKDFNLNKELVDYLAFELKRRFQGQVVVRPVIWNKESLIEDKDFWKGLAAASPSALILTGNVFYAQNLQKALPKREAKDVNGPFKPVPQGLSERVVSNLVLDFCLIEGATGEILFRKEFKENMAFTSANQPFSFAFFELLPRLKQRFFGIFMAEGARQERYLIAP